MDYKNSFGWLPGEEGVTDYFSLSSVANMLKHAPQFNSDDNRVGTVIRGTYAEGSEAVEYVYSQVVKLMNEKEFHLMFPTHCAESRVGWDFGWVIDGPLGNRYLIFVQAKNVTYLESNQAEIHFDYGGYNKNLQSKVFGLWLKEVAKRLSPEVQVRGWYLLYGIPDTPVAWLNWERVATLQHGEIDNKSLSNAAVEHAIRCNKNGSFLEHIVGSEDNFSIDVQSIKDEKVMEELEELKWLMDKRDQEILTELETLWDSLKHNVAEVNGVVQWDRAEPNQKTTKPTGRNQSETQRAIRTTAMLQDLFNSIDPNVRGLEEQGEGREEGRQEGPGRLAVMSPGSTPFKMKSKPKKPQPDKKGETDRYKQI
ncbi:hypothetical protein BDV93DRAFT_525823 [Ceratobasidium sp. AG-I]|nr:hypothetical protein BDV93DRAFT_525823 [Ceratobasidium sp. AG-I]